MDVVPRFDRCINYKKGDVMRISRQSFTAFNQEVGALSAEYATVAIAACGAGGILYKFLTSSSFASLLADILGKAFQWVFHI